MMGCHDDISSISGIKVVIDVVLLFCDISRKSSAAPLRASFKVLPGEFSGGHFINAWKALIDEFEDSEDKPTSDIRQSYYDLKMGADDKPAVFFMKLEDYRRRLKARGDNLCEAEKYLYHLHTRARTMFCATNTRHTTKQCQTITLMKNAYFVQDSSI